MVRRVRSAVSVELMLQDMVINVLKVVFRNQAVRIKDYKIIAFSPGKAIVSGKALPLVLFKKIIYFEPVFVRLDNLLRGDL